MDVLARYVAGPVALASLGLGVFDRSPYIAVLLWVLAVLWGIAAVVAWRKERLDLAGRTLRLANRILACVPGRNRLPPMRMPSAYGTNATAAKFISESSNYKPDQYESLAAELAYRIPRLVRKDDAL